MNDETEQKSLPASQKKLRDGRRKGQVSHSRDLVTGFALTCMFIYLLLAGPAMADRLVALVHITSELADRPFAESSGRVIELALDILLLTSVPPVAVVVGADLVSGIASTFGPVFSFELVKPKVDHINPSQGLKRIFSVRNVVEFAKAVVKVVILATAFVLIMRSAIEPLFETPVCGEPCLVTAALGTVKPLAATAIVAFVAIGLFDLLVQRRLFLRDMRMTRTEAKRETKDLQGDPLIRGERRRLRQEAVGGGKVRAGMQHAVVAITHGDLVVGLRFRPGETPVPVVVCKGRGEAGSAMLAEARQRSIPVVDDEAFVNALTARHRVGDFIALDLFEMAARALVAARSTGSPGGGAAS
jgi:type III secretion protein U